MKGVKMENKETKENIPASENAGLDLSVKTEVA